MSRFYSDSLVQCVSDNIILNLSVIHRTGKHCTKTYICQLTEWKNRLIKQQLLYKHEKLTPGLLVSQNLFSGPTTVRSPMLGAQQHWEHILEA